MSWGAAFRLVPWLAIALLLGAVLWLRGDVIGAKADRDTAQLRVTALEEANGTLARQIAIMEQARVDNDAIAAAVAAQLDTNQIREVHTREVIKEAIRNDPETSAWAATPVPDSVRAGLRTGPLGAPAS